MKKIPTQIARPLYKEAHSGHSHINGCEHTDTTAKYETRRACIHKYNKVQCTPTRTHTYTHTKIVQRLQTIVNPANKMTVPRRRRGAKRNLRMLVGPLTRNAPPVIRMFAARSIFRLKKQLSSGSGARASTIQHAPRPRHACPHSLRFCRGKLCSIHSSTMCCEFLIVFPAAKYSRLSLVPPSSIGTPPPRSRSI